MLKQDTFLQQEPTPSRPRPLPVQLGARQIAPRLQLHRGAELPELGHRGDLLIVCLFVCLIGV